jgi:hypothetical protein
MHGWSTMGAKNRSLARWRVPESWRLLCIAVSLVPVRWLGLVPL